MEGAGRGHGPGWGLREEACPALSVVSHSGPRPHVPGQPGREGEGLRALLTHLHTLMEP